VGCHVRIAAEAPTVDSHALWMAFLGRVLRVGVVAWSGGSSGCLRRVFRFERVELAYALISDTGMLYPAPRPDVVYRATQGVPPIILSRVLACSPRFLQHTKRRRILPRSLICKGCGRKSSAELSSDGSVPQDVHIIVYFTERTRGRMDPVLGG
jgi:hypothetical protein